MSLAPRILAAAGLLAVPALLAVGSQALSRPAEVPLQERQTVVIDLAPAGTTAPPPGGTTVPTPAGEGGPAEPAPPSPAPGRTSGPVPGTPPPVPVPATPVPEVPASGLPADQGTPGLVERGVLGTTDDDGTDGGSDGTDTDDDAAAPDGGDG